MGVSKDEGGLWFETHRFAMLLTMRAGRGRCAEMNGGDDAGYRPKPIFFRSRSFAAMSRARRSPNTLRSA